MGKYYIKFGLSKNFNAGSKAMKDIMALLESRGYRVVSSLPADAGKILKLMDIPLLFFTLLFKVGRRGTIVYFIPSNALRIRFLSFFRKIVGFRLLCFVNDVESMRMVKSEKYAVGEMKGIATADVVLVPNENSVRILREKHQMLNPMIPVGVWDYLVDDSMLPVEHGGEMNPRGVVAYAGNLNLAPFIDALQSVGLSFRIWGSGKAKGGESPVVFMGEEYPERLVGKIAGCSWGLVWSGSSVETCNGQVGDYLKFNNSHKCGLYLAAGIPLIVWQESGMAQFVRKQQVGICVSSLNEAADVIRRMDNSVYSIYRRNAQHMGGQVRKGDFFLRALAEAENFLNRKKYV